MKKIGMKREFEGDLERIRGNEEKRARGRAVLAHSSKKNL
jgi:hypothetical protein